MDAPQQNFVTKLGQQARVLKTARDACLELTTLYNGTPNWGALITQEEIDSVTSFHAAGLTKAQVDGVIFTMQEINAHILTYLTEFVMLANL